MSLFTRIGPILITLFSGLVVGQIKLPPEEIGYLSLRMISETFKWVSGVRSNKVDLPFVQKQFAQVAESKCLKPDSIRQPILDSKQILETRFSRKTKSEAERISNLICGVEEFALYDATETRLLVRRTLNRARQMVLNIQSLDASDELKLEVLEKAYELALSNYRPDTDDLNSKNTDENYAYKKNGESFKKMIEGLETPTSNKIKVVILENTVAWLASDLANDVHFAAFSAEIIDLLNELSTKRDVDPQVRAFNLRESLKVLRF